MTDDRRYSIIPAGAVADQRLEGRDLQVLCFLGTHTDKRGWCFLRQGEIARHLGTSRSTVQRSLTRLIDAGYVTTRDFTGPRPHACHAYRVIMDADDPKLEPPADAGPDDNDDQRCPQVGTSAGGASPMHTGAQTGTGTSAPEVPTHARAHNDQDSSSSGEPRARDHARKISPEAFRLADEIARIAGHDPEFLPTRWMSVGAPNRVQAMLDKGWRAEMMIDMAKAMMRQKKGGPPATIEYFEPGFAEAHELQSQPISLPTTEQNDVQTGRARSPGNDRSRRSSGNAFAGISARLRGGQATNAD